MKKRILVVDDEKNLAKALKSRFIHWGYEADAALTGEEALDKVETFKPHLIILDIRMPKIGGIEVLETTKKRNPNIRVLILTASQSKDTYTICMKKQADGFMLKPFELHAIKEKVEEIFKSIDVGNSYDQ